MRGRKPVPTQLRIVRGNPSKRPLPKDEPQPALDAQMPQWMSPAAEKHWPIVAEQLHAAGLLTVLDVPALALYCEAFARWQDANEKVVKHGAVVKGAAGYPVKSPYLSVANRAYEQMVRMLEQFGMTPSSRSRVTGTKPDQSAQYAKFVRKD